MPTYYKYAERSADSQVNWAEVGKGISDMLADEVKIREEKKAEIDKNTRDFQQTLQTAPQGQFQDANKFTNDYAHSMMEQQMIDTKLLKAGKMKLQDYTLRRQNYIDGTNVLFDLQKLYQENYKNRMDGIQTDELQALNGFNMASVEGFGDFSKSRAVINSATGIVSVGIMKPNPQTGVMELTDDVVPVNVLKGKILATIPTWKADEVMNNTVKGFGDKIRVLQTIATQTKAGSITELTGVGALEASKDPQFKADIQQFNKAVDEQINSYFSNPYHITSVLTQNLKKYNQESYTFDKDIAKKDSSKILLKINQSNGLPTLDTEAPSYKAQELEARDWVKSQLLSKMDSKVKVDLGGFVPQPRQMSEGEIQRADAKKEAIVLGEQISNLITGDANKIATSIAYIESMDNVTQVIKSKDAIKIITKDKEGQSVTNSFPLSGLNAGDIGKSLVRQLNPDKLSQTTIIDYVNQFNKNKKVNLADTLTGKKTVDFFQTPTKAGGTIAGGNIRE